MKIKIAMLQISSFGFDQKKNLEKGEAFCRKAKELDSDIVLFLEMWNIGYESFDDSLFDSKFDPEKITGQFLERANRWKANAIDINSEFITHFQKLAKELGLAIVITFLQKVFNVNSMPENSAILIDRQGKIIINYSKVHTCDFSLEYFCESGKKFYVAELNTKAGEVRTGIMICFDREFPESARELMLHGAEVILVPNACFLDSHRSAQLSSRAFENMTVVVTANYPYPKCNGKSQAYSPVAYDEKGNEKNNVVVMADGNEGIFIAEFDMEEIRKYRTREVWGNKFRKPAAYGK